MISFASCVDELVKIAEGEKKKYEVSADRKKNLRKFQQKLQPGDIILTTRGLTDYKSKETSAGIRSRLGQEAGQFFGGRYHHAALYSGKGKMVDLTPSGGVVERPISEIGVASAKALRPTDVGTRERRDAVKKVRKRIGDPYHFSAATKAWIWDKVGAQGNPEESARSMFCTSLVADAYKGKKTFSGKAPELVGPWDIKRDKNLKDVGTLVGEI